MIRRIKDKKGFTLVELLVVIAIIGILAVVAVPALFKNINKAKIARLESDYNAVKSAMLSYYTDNNELTSNFNDLEIDSLNLGKTPIGGDYKIRIKDFSNKIGNEGNNGTTVSIQAHEVNSDGTTGQLVNLDKQGDAYFTMQGHENNKLYINNEQFKKLVQDIGHENIYTSSRPQGTGYQTGEIYIRLANNILPKPE